MAAFFRSLLHWQHWPFYFFYFPLSFAWVGYYIKTRSLWYFASSNPTISFGGFEGEGKSEMYNLLPPQYCPKTIMVQPGTSLVLILQQVQQRGIRYPFAVKPDVGMKGILFRKIENEAQLQTYHAQMPAPYLIQEFLDLPYEVSVFYCRMPNTEKGTITAMIQKNLPEVVGNGKATLLELVAQLPDAQSWIENIKTQQGQNLSRVLPAGEKYTLSHIGNLLNGATFINLHQHIDENLLALFDRISHQSQFYYGRYDIKCTSVDELKRGENFYILEFNGAGSVPNHIYTGTYTLMGAYKEILLHWRWLYHISRYNHQKGIRYWGVRKGFRFLNASKKHFKKLKQLDKELVLQ